MPHFGEGILSAINALLLLIRTELTFQHQPDAAISQVNPVSGTWYTVLDTTAKVRIINIGAMITWAVTQPTPLEVRITIDGITINFYVNNPVTATDYNAQLTSATTPPFDAQLQTFAVSSRSFLLEGRSVKVEVRITWAVTQPTPLVCRVKWAKR